MNGTHVPVLVKEVVDGLSVEPGKKYIDATVGAGGHAVEIVRRGGIVLGIDQDNEALALAKERLKDTTLVHGNFRDIEKIGITKGFTNVDGVLFDLGVSSLQLDTPQRGFSYRYTDAPLDLRMDQRKGETAAELINRASEKELYDIFSEFGEEQHSRSISAALYRARPVRTVGDLVQVVGTNKSVLSRVFQALRIAVNDELGSLKAGLEGAHRLLKPGGKLVVISFHSLEDRIVKRWMRNSGWDVVTKRPLVPGTEEVDTNRRSRSAKLRIAIKKPYETQSSID